MIHIDFVVGGEKVSTNQLGSALERAVLDQVKERIQKAVGNAICPEHGSRASIIAEGTSLNDLSFNISGCCDKLVEIVKLKLK